MEQNSLIEIGSKANVIISFNNETIINGSTYAVNEPYLFLQNVDVLITYKNFDKIASSGPNRIANNAIYPDLLKITDTPFSRKLAALLLNYSNTNQSYYKHNFLTLEAENGVIYLPYAIVNSDFKVYDSDFNEIVATYSSGNNSLLSANLIAGTDYLVFFASELIGTKFTFCQPSIGYMNIEIQTIGNIDKITKQAIVYIAKASLNSIINFNFLCDDQVKIPLSFNIIENSGYIIFED